MCLAIPMQVVKISTGNDALLDSSLAIVEADGMRKEIRLDLVDRMPEVGDYLIIHAGFAINCLDAAEAEINLELMRELAAGMEDVPGGESS
ncbi:MAG TPA: HypC/HybG/HupF family hydrogenase formation chaperone [Desulfobacterales bacterium]|nr:HypC/HybG/HupF family hydrogenase formation chaperone [Desulfobacterales bacterium]HIP39917.1 HypC/HybG/HupF family hydrogenase formation chaperone [Desulfocapsa sulfexigens]